jgi:hypothetical protein
MSNLDKFVDLYKEAGDIWELPENCEVASEGDWVQDGKYQHCESIVKFEDEFFSVNESRSGSYHTDWYYNDTYIFPVERREETIVKVSWAPTGKSVEVPSRY